MGWEAFGRTSNQQRLEQMGLVDEEELRRLAKGPPATWLELSRFLDGWPRFNTRVYTSNTGGNVLVNQLTQLT